MKKIFLMFILIGAITLVGYAQNKDAAAAKTAPAGQQKAATPEQKAQVAVDRLDKTVTLTADQKTKVKELALTNFAKVEAIREKYKAQADKKEIERTEIHAAQKEYDEGVAKILTADQIKKREDAAKAEKAAKASDKGGQPKEATPEKKQ